MPEITDITAISVVEARMMPGSVIKLRSLLPRSDWTAPVTASQTMRACSFNPMWRGPLGAGPLGAGMGWALYLPGRRGSRLRRGSRQNPLHDRRIHPKPVRPAADEPEVAA